MVYGRTCVHLNDCFSDEQHEKDWLFESRDETDDETLIRRIVRDAREAQLKYRACAQTSLYPLCVHLGLGGREVLTAMATPTGGFGGTEICGALVGGLSAIGLEFGRVDYSEHGGPRDKGQGSFTWSQRMSTELRERFAERTGGFIRCGDLMQHHYGVKLAPVNRTDPMELGRVKSAEIFSMWSTYAVELVVLTAEITAEMILRFRRQRGLVTPLMAIPGWYNRAWEMQQITEFVNPTNIAHPGPKLQK